MSKELTKKQNTEVSKEVNLGAGGQVSAADLLIGRLGCLQHLSQLVKDGVAKAGQIVDTESGEVLGGKGTDKPMEYVVLSVNKYWVITENGEYKTRIPGTHQNEYLWEEGNIKRMFNISFYVLLKKDLDNDVIMPYEMSFRSTELRTARKIMKMLFIMGTKKQASWNRYFTASVNEKKKGQHSWYAYDINMGAETSANVREMSSAVFSQIGEKSPDMNDARTDEYQSKQNDVNLDSIPF